MERGKGGKKERKLSSSWELEKKKKKEINVRNVFLRSVVKYFHGQEKNIKRKREEKSLEII